MNERHHLFLDRLPFVRNIVTWRHPNASVIARIEGNDRAEMKQWLEEHAQAELALQRVDHLGTIAATAWSPSVKHLLSIAVGLFGATLIGASVGMIVDSTGRGPIAATGGALAGGACAVLTERYASRSMMKRGMRLNSQQAVEQVETELADCPEPTELDRHFYASKLQLLQQVEAMYLAEEPRSEKLMAIAAICTEGVVSLVLTWPAGPLLAMASATFPILINLLVAKVQADRFEVPEACEGLIPLYEAHIPSDQIPALEALQIARLHAGLQYVATVRPPKGIRSVGQAKGLAQMNFAQAQIATLEAQGVETVIGCEQKYQQALESLPDRCPPPDVDVAGMTAEEAQDAEQEWCDKWLEAERAKLADAHRRELELIQAEYGRAISFWQNIERQGGQAYRDNEPQEDTPRAA